MALIWTLAKKEFLLLLRDRLALILLLVMPLLFILILGLLLGEGFGQKPDDRLRVSVVDLDKEGKGLDGQPWSKVVLKDLEDTAGIRVEIIPNEDEAIALIRDHKRAAVLVFGENFSTEMNKCSFLSGTKYINPFHRDGVYFEKVGARLLKDPTQGGAASIIEKVAQVSMLSVILPWMIGQAFEQLSDPQFIEILGKRVNLPSPMSSQQMQQFLELYSEYEKGKISTLTFATRANTALSSWPKGTNRAFNAAGGLSSWAINHDHRVSLGETLKIAAENSAKYETSVTPATREDEYRKKVG